MFKQMESYATQRLHFFNDAETKLKAIVAIHSTVRGPAIGGCRFIPYTDDSDAITDAIRLAQGMSYKAALAGLPHGGGKAVVIVPNQPFDRAALMRSFGRCINTLNGEYITAMDSGTQVTDMDQIKKSTHWVTCTSTSGDPSPYTALGVFEGIKASVEFKLRRKDLTGLHVSIQGLGHVGYEVARLLHQAGARLTVTDIDPSKIQLCKEHFSAKSVEPEEIYNTPADIFCPCGLGAILNTDTIKQLQVSIVAGSANNQLEKESHGDLLSERGILYAPDYLINSGGLIFVSLQHAHKSTAAIHHKVLQIGPSLHQIYRDSERSEHSIHRIANEKAEAIINASEEIHSVA
jgi:leucine dehydrogenase